MVSRKCFFLIFCFLLALGAVSACGKKPGKLEGPAEPDFTASEADRAKAKANDGQAPKNSYPQTYPKPWL